MGWLSSGRHRPVPKRVPTSMVMSLQVYDAQSSTSALTSGYSGKDVTIPLTRWHLPLLQGVPLQLRSCSRHHRLKHPLVAHLSVERLIHRIKVLLQLLAPAAVMVVHCHPLACRLFLLFLLFFPPASVLSWSNRMAMKVGRIQGKFGDNFQFRLIVADARPQRAPTHFNRQSLLPLRVLTSGISLSVLSGASPMLSPMDIHSPTPARLLLPNQLRL